MLAAAGANVVAVDPAARLLDVARTRAAAAGAAVDFRQGEAAAIPLDDASVDLVVSVFAVIFAPDPAAAMADVARVLRPHGRIVYTAWVPGGVIGRLGFLSGQMVREALGAPEPPPPFSWHERDAVAELAGAHGLSVQIDEHTIAFTAASPAAFVEDDEHNHPMAVSALRAVEAAGGDANAIRARLIEAATEGNEDPKAFRGTSRYRVVTLTR